ncbi:unnamed protein product [Umbelopsis ramanniana]
MDSDYQQQSMSTAIRSNTKRNSIDSSINPSRFGPSLLKRRATDITPLAPSAISKAVLKSNPVPQPLTPGLYRAESFQRVKPAQPLRSTKTSQKLVLFPGAAEPPVDDDDDQIQDDGLGLRLPLDFHLSGSRTIAERMTKDQRDFANLPRLSAYCTAEGNNLKELSEFLRQQHHVSPRFYDECLYARYHFPLMTLRPGGRKNASNVRVRSAPWPGNSSHSNEHTTSYDQYVYDYDEDHYREDVDQQTYSHYSPHRHGHEDTARYEAQTLPDYNETAEQADSSYDYHHEGTSTKYDYTSSPTANEEISQYIGSNTPEFNNVFGSPNELADTPVELTHSDTEFNDQEHATAAEATTSNDLADNEFPTTPKTPDTNSRFEGGELFIFDYGVVVLWNFSRAQELLLLEDLAPFRIRPLEESEDDLQEMQIEEMHFQYDTNQAKPRIFNDMITLKSGNHMIKLTISHGVSQSAVLARFEDMMDNTIEDTKHIPKKLAQTGRLDMNRTEITQINGHLFKLRMHVNLVSNVLDTPEIFWSEPSLQPLYKAIRDYLEIPQRAKILNDRCGVISDLLSMLREHLNHFGVEYQTLIIIWLIVIAVFVACIEIAVKALNQTKTPTVALLL